MHEARTRQPVISLEQLFQQAIDVVEQVQVGYLVYGGVALPAWGDVITTQDLDLLVQGDEADAARLITAYRNAGFRLPDHAKALFPIDTWTPFPPSNRAAPGPERTPMTWIATIEPGDASGELAEAYREVVSHPGGSGRVAEVIKCMGLRPRGLLALWRLNMDVTFGASTLGRVREEMIATAVSSLNDCFY